MSSDTSSTSSNTVTTQCVDTDCSRDSLNSLSLSDKACVDGDCPVTCDRSPDCDHSPVYDESPAYDDDPVCVDKERRRSYCCNSITQCVWGTLLLLMSVSGFVLTPLQFMLQEKLNMRPGFPPYDWWADPPDEVRLRVYVFNVTNYDRFAAGVDDKLNVREIGPIVYLEKLLHSNIRFNDNGTLTYTAKRFPIFLPEENNVDLNASIIVPNLAVLGIASYLHNANFLVKTGFRLLVNSHSSNLFVKRTIYQYLWELGDPVLDTSKNLAPGLVPVNNMGMLARIYSDFTDEVTVHIGPKFSHNKFFQIDRFRGQPQIPGYDAEECPDRLFGSTEGVMYHQYLSKQDVLLYWRKTVCKLMPLYFDSEFTLDSVPVYRYNLSESVYDRVQNGTDCYNTYPSLPAGVSDASKCYFDYPMVVSFPHFYTGGIQRDQFVTGLEPDREKHNSYIIVEPNTGTPFRSVARMQSNLHLYDLSGFSNDYNKLSNLIIPLFWAEYNQEGLPDHIRWTIYFMVVILPPLSNVIFTVTLILGSYFILKQIYVHNLKNDSLNSLLQLKSKNVNNLARNKIFSMEKEAFIKIPNST